MCYSPLFDFHSYVGEIRGRGLLAGVELVANRETKQPFERSLGAGHTFHFLHCLRGPILHYRN